MNELELLFYIKAVLVCSFYVIVAYAFYFWPWCWFPQILTETDLKLNDGEQNKTTVRVMCHALLFDQVHPFHQELTQNVY